MKALPLLPEHQVSKIHYYVHIFHMRLQPLCDQFLNQYFHQILQSCICIFTSN